jgi:hypothetical protein
MRYNLKRANLYNFFDIEHNCVRLSQIIFTSLKNSFVSLEHVARNISVDSELYAKEKHCSGLWLSSWFPYTRFQSMTG